jgi:hypothetical protein
MNFSVEAASGAARLATETRVETTDPDSRRRFERYWRVIQPGSAAIRRSWLRAAKRWTEGGEETSALARVGELGSKGGGPAWQELPMDGPPPRAGCGCQKAG